MDKVINGIYNICSALQPLTVAVLILILAILGLNLIITGGEGKAKFKEDAKHILIGAAITFSAMTIGKEISSWFL